MFEFNINSTVTPAAMSSSRLISFPLQSEDALKLLKSGATERICGDKYYITTAGSKPGTKKKQCVFSCNFCLFTCNAQQEFVQHMKQHTFKCSSCTFRAYSKTNIYIHMLEAHSANFSSYMKTNPNMEVVKLEPEDDEREDDCQVVRYEPKKNFMTELSEFKKICSVFQNLSVVKNEAKTEPPDADANSMTSLTSICSPTTSATTTGTEPSTSTDSGTADHVPWSLVDRDVMMTKNKKISKESKTKKSPTIRVRISPVHNRTNEQTAGQGRTSTSKGESGPGNTPVSLRVRSRRLVDSNLAAETQKKEKTKEGNTYSENPASQPRLRSGGTKGSQSLRLVNNSLAAETQKKEKTKEGDTYSENPASHPRLSGGTKGFKCATILRDRGRPPKIEKKRRVPLKEIMRPAHNDPLTEHDEVDEVTSPANERRVTRSVFRNVSMIL